MTEPVGDTAADQTAETDTTSADTAAGSEATYTKAQVEQMIASRMARVKENQAADYQDLKAKAEKLAEIEESNKTELEKERDRAAKAEERATKIEAEAKETRLRSAIIAEAAKPGRNVVDVNDVIALLDRSTLTLDDDGSPTNIAEAMDSLLTAKPHLVASGGSRGNADQGARGGGAKQLGRDDLQKMSPAEIVKAQAEGRLDTILQGQT